MQRNWFKELGLEKLALNMADFYGPAARVVDVTPRPAPSSFPLAPSGGALARYNPRMARFQQFMGRGAPQLKNVAATVLPATASAGPAASKLGLLAKLFPKGSGSAAALGALLPIGLLLASKLFSGSRDQAPEWAKIPQAATMM